MTEIVRSRTSLAADLAVGAIAGMAATAAMAVLFQLSARAGLDPTEKDTEGRPRIGSPEAATEGVDRVAETVTGQEVPEDYKQPATSGFQFLFGAGLGAAYALAARFEPGVTAGRGTLFGAATWAVFDEALVPATGLSGKPQDSPVETHAGALAAHVVFGAVTEAVRGLFSRG